jgi:RNA polymerase II subunit A small phosphatase-like protein
LEQPYSIPNLLVVFDLDETLVFTRRVRCGEPESPFPDDFTIDLGESHYKVFVRPGARELIRACQSRFLVGVWSSAKADYVRALSERLFDVSRLAFVRHRDHCQKSEHMFTPIKNLSEIDHPIERIILIDDDPETARHNPGNLLPVRVYREFPFGDDLYRAWEKIKALAGHHDVRTVIHPGGETF